MAMAALTRAAAAATANSCVARAQLPTPAPSSQFQSRGAVGRQWSSGASGAGTLRRRRGSRDDETGRASRVSMAAFPDLHALSVLAADLVNVTDFEVSVGVAPAREVITDRSVWAMSEQSIKTFYVMFSLVFCWGCCVFGSMNDVFYDSEEYRKAGGNGTGHWIYDQQEREERAARDEMWSEDLIKEIEEKAEEVRRAEEEKEKDLELV